MNKKLISTAFLYFLFMTSFLSAGEKALDSAACVRIGVERNYGIKIAEHDVSGAGEITARINAQYEPVLSAGLSKLNIENTGANAVYGDVIQKDNLTMSASKKLSSTGGNLSVSWENERDDSASAFKTMASAPNPTFNTDVTLAYNQPLLKNFAGRNDKSAFEAAETGEKMSAYALEIAVNVLASAIEKAFIELGFQEQNLQTQKKFLKHDRELLDVNKRKYADGLIEEADLIATESATAIKEMSVLLSEDRVMNARDALRNIMGLAERDAYVFDTSSSAEYGKSPQKIKEADVLRKAFAKRPDIRAAELKIKIDKLNKKIRKNETLPGLELNTRYGLTGSAGSWGDDYDSFEPNWYIGLSLKYFPAGRMAGSLLRSGELAVLKSAVQFEEIMSAVKKECREITRRVNTHGKYLRSAEKILILQKKKLELEERKFRQGRSSLQWLLTFRDDLVRAEIDHKKALADYGKALADLKLITGEGR
ncbi:MAG: TolC family protein [Elusimicrobiota bacterium]|nr:TolC family protein [Elusimicrobiota bacterium]